ncbi:cell wall elongation regulator TseB-like domain-containing protein [Companilactobacillus nodensis]|uniref:Extracellular protein n=1 Tax=Companilactobacillus nodensis DSM 19682 = JCM 14932 = NBRC 107160 TaxID=1423775 RepID=A0A0R1KHV2_9LACO|nr:PepSY domain-containing protein [Companilactobacillus nodensis]KRK80505.1 extracellular protein precursor [Companilactobacillus nodensis DSM 19682 = JCM 14932 = NBRC 107160]
MNRSTKILLAISLIALVIVSALTYINLSAAPNSSAKSQADNIAEQKAGITQPDYFGNFTREKQYYSVGGLTKTDKYRYVIINAKSGKTKTINLNNAPVRKDVIQGVADRYSATKILHINLGMYKNKPTWEVAFKNKKGTIGYNLVDFHTGKSVQIINNL